MKTKVAVITGASGLIGAELCRKYLQANFQVFGLDIKAGELSDPNYKFLKCDLSKPETLARATKSIKSINVLINNAAATELTFKSFDTISLGQWNKGLAINLTSQFVLAKIFHRALRSNRGSIVNITSTRHLMSEPNTAIYSSSKGGIFSLTHSLAITLGPEVRVNCISPGWIADPKKKLKPKDHSQHPVGRVGCPADIAEMAFYLTSDAAGFITGQDFIVDGGMTRKMIYV